ncbi:MAG: succinate dehydrogenase, cytochrome b556 subunit [Formivibrio sp.]|nr:succinate dehydrogenase, cytochrome b556 subunit [Formivibrio sp.]
MNPSRPKHLALWQIRLPLPGVISILHRVSGAAMFVVIPLLLYALEGSLSSAERYGEFRTVIAHPLVKLILLGVLWAFLHHACAGVRYLLMDVHQGVELPAARRSAKLVLVVSLTLTVLIGALTW